MEEMTFHMPYCSNCGATMDDRDLFCGVCGKGTTPPPYPSLPTAFSEISNYETPRRNGIRALFSASGRIGRVEWFVTFLVCQVLVFSSSLIPSDGETDGRRLLLASILLIPAFFANMFAWIKRFHDFDQSGFLVLIALIPLAAIVLFFFLLLKGSSNGPNRFGYPNSGSII